MAGSTFTRPPHHFVLDGGTLIQLARLAMQLSDHGVAIAHAFVRHGVACHTTDAIVMAIANDSKALADAILVIAEENPQPHDQWLACQTRRH